MKENSELIVTRIKQVRGEREISYREYSVPHSSALKNISSFDFHNYLETRMCRRSKPKKKDPGCGWSCVHPESGW